MHPLLRPHLLRVLLAVFVLPAALFAEKPFAFAGTPGQLPKDVVPRHYALRIQPDLDARTTTGTARIELEVLQPVRELVLNAHELAIDSAALADNPAAPGPLTPRLDPAKQTLTLPVELSAGRHTITIAYRGKIGTQAEGFFIDKYPTPTGDKLMLGTQFEPTDARRVFPCWDEPVYRATYDITLVVPEKLMAVANTPIVRETALSGGLKEVVFARTPAMASYLVALYAGEFETVEGEQDGVKLRIITTEGKRASAAYALEGTKSSNDLNPDWQLWLRANTNKENAMALDARRTTHPIQRPIANESQANDAFDVISYQKGQSFLRMLEGYLGEDTFRAGIRLYVKQHQYSNTTTADLWAALGEASGKPVVALAAGWTEQPGFPVILVSGTGEGANRALKLEQLRFTLNDPAAAPLLWKLPVTLANTANLPAPPVGLLA